MAFATSNVRQSSVGDMRALRGDWTGSAGDASGTVTFDGARVYIADFTHQDAVTGELTRYPVTVSLSGALSTITVHSHDDVTNGRFLIVGV